MLNDRVERGVAAIEEMISQFPKSPQVDLTSSSLAETCFLLNSGIPQSEVNVQLCGRSTCIQLIVLVLQLPTF